MKYGLLSILVVSLCLAAPAGAGAQSRPGPQGRRVVDKEVKPAVVEAKPVIVVDIPSTFSLSTGSERWALDDPLPAQSVDFSGQRMSFTDRQVNASVSSDGADQLLFPVSWFPRYSDVNPDVKYVVVKYKDGKAYQIMAEYLPERQSMPKESFQLYPDGKSFYSNVSVVRQDGQVYLKQVTSKGVDDGKGGYYLDMLIIYRVEDKTPPPAAAAAPAAKPAPGKRTKP